MKVNKKTDLNYLNIVLILCGLYILTNAFGTPLNKADFIIITYMLITPRINDGNALSSALVFGLFYDITYQFYLGLGVLIFMLFNFIKLHAYNIFRMNILHYNLIYALVIFSLYTFLTLIFYGYGVDSFSFILLKYVIYDSIFFIVLSVFFGGKLAFSYT